MSYIYAEYKKGRFTESEAQKLCMNMISTFKYGDENNDFFWIHGLDLKMKMHPHVKNLIGKDLSAFKDAEGKFLFVEMNNVVKKYDEGFVPYKWQYKDQTDKIVLKVAYVKLFRPWNWVIGSGVYFNK